MQTRQSYPIRKAIWLAGAFLLLAGPSPAQAAAARRFAPPVSVQAARPIEQRVGAINAGASLRWQWLLGGSRSLLWSPDGNPARLFRYNQTLFSSGRRAWSRRPLLISRLSQGTKARGDWLGRWSHILRHFQIFPDKTGHDILDSLNLQLSAELAPVLSRDAQATEDLQCIADLIEAGLDFQVGPASPGIRTPVTVKTWILGGVRYLPYYPDQTITQMDCRLVRAMVRAGPILQSLGVRAVIWSSAYRPPDRAQVLGAKPYNKHTEGLAIDVHAFRFGGKIRADVGRNYEKGLGFQRDASCLGRPDTQEGFLLRLVACRLDASDLFQEILTPDYDSDHWNHFHLAVFRPGETRRHKRTALLEVPLEKIPGWALTRLGHARPELEIWKDVARLPWPKGYARLAERVRSPEGNIAAAAVSLAKVGRYLVRLALPSLVQRRKSTIR